MNPPNEVLNTIDAINDSIIDYVGIVADNYNYLTSIEQPTPAQTKKIEQAATALNKLIADHEKLQEQFANLLQYLQDNEDFCYKCKADALDATNALSHYKIYNKNAIELNEKIKYLEKTRLLLFKELIKLQDGKKDQQH